MEHAPSLLSIAVDYNTTLVLALETSGKNWVVAAHVPGTGVVKAKQVIAPNANPSFPLRITINRQKSAISVPKLLKLCPCK